MGDAVLDAPQGRDSPAQRVPSLQGRAVVVDHLLGGVQPRPHPRELAAHAGRPRQGHAQPRVPQHRRRRQLPTQLQVDGELTALEEGGDLRAQQVRRALFVARGDPVRDGLGDVAALEEPVGGPGEHAGALVGVGRQAAQQHVAEQPVAAVPLPVRVERRHEQVGAVQRVEDGGRSGAVQGGVAQRPGQPLEHGGPDEQVAVVRGEPVDDLEGQVVEDVPVAAVEPGRRLGRPLRVADRQRRELQSGGPALGALGSTAASDASTGVSPTAVSSAAASSTRKPRSAARSSVSSPRARRRASGSGGSDAARDHHPQRGRQVGEEELDALVDGRRSDEVEVVEDEHVLGVDGRELVEQRRQREVDRLEPGRGRAPAARRGRARRRRAAARVST